MTEPVTKEGQQSLMILRPPPRGRQDSGAAATQGSSDKPNLRIVSIEYGN
jgi:hypothetical protein